jgi:hypothetical protein
MIFFIANLQIINAIHGLPSALIKTSSGGGLFFAWLDTPSL